MEEPGGYSLWGCKELDTTERLNWTAKLLGPWDSPSKNTGVGCHSLLQGIYPTQGSNSCLLSLPALAGGFFTTSGTWEAGSAGKESACSSGDLGSVPRVGKIPWRRQWLPTPVSRPGELQRVGHDWAKSPAVKTSNFTLHTIYQMYLMYLTMTFPNFFIFQWVFVSARAVKHRS